MGHCKYHAETEDCALCLRADIEARDERLDEADAEIAQLLAYINDREAALRDRDARLARVAEAIEGCRDGRGYVASAAAIADVADALHGWQP